MSARRRQSVVSGLFASVMAFLESSSVSYPSEQLISKARRARRGLVRSDRDRQERRAFKLIRAHKLPDVCYFPTIGAWAKWKGLCR